MKSLIFSLPNEFGPVMLDLLLGVALTCKFLSEVEPRMKEEMKENFISITKFVEEKKAQ